MRTLRRSLVLLVAAAALAAVPAGSASASTGDYQAAAKRCHARPYSTILITRANNMGCQRAKREMRRYDGYIKRRFTTPGGFHCKRKSGNRYGGRWRCHKDDKAFGFRFAD